jgi:hypothetical protein
MNLEQKANKHSKNNYNFGSNPNYASEKSFISGYSECKFDLIEFLKVNHKATVKQVLEHLNGMK